MSSRDTQLSRIGHTGLFTFLLVFILLLLAGALLISNSRTRYEDFVNSQFELMQTSAVDAVRIIETYIEQTNRQVRLFSKAEAENIRRLAASPDDQQLISDMNAELGKHIPDYFTFTLTGPDGEVLLDDFDGKVGDICLADIRSFGSSQHPHELMIHPNPVQYHFDIMTRVEISDTEQGIFFVSFKPDVLAQLMANSEIHGHRLLMLHRDRPGLIEMTSQGARDLLADDVSLARDVYDNITIRLDVPGTKWELVYLPDEQHFMAVQDDYDRQALHEILIMFTFSMVMLLLIRFEEAKRRDLEDALQRSHDELEDKVSQRTMQLHRSEQRYALAAKGVNDGIWEWDAQTDRIYFSPRWQKIANVKRALNEGRLQSWLKLIHEDDRELFSKAFNSALDGSEDGIELVFRFAAQDGAVRWCNCRAAVEPGDDGRPARMAGSISDITGQVRAQQQLEHGSLHDALTGLANRALFIDRLDQSIDSLHRNSGYHYAVLYLSLDRFKSINDTLGHQVGDELLLIVAERLAASMRPGDTLARLDGDEFVILMNDYDHVSEVTELATRLLFSVSSPYSIEAEVLSITASIGITLGTYQYDDAADVLRDAGIAMYRAMEQGHGEYFIFNVNIRHEVMARIRTETLLRSAISNQQMKIYYQPVIDLADDSIYSFEALLRWMHPEKGLVLPDEFMPLAEETGLIVPIGLWAVEVSCRQLKSWHMEYPQCRDLTLSVNLSCKQFRQAGLVGEIDSLLQQTCVERSKVSLSLEITESTVMQDVSRSAEIIGELRQLGVRFFVDDFGTGYSSLAYLQHFPVDALKIDRQFIARIDSDEDSRAIVRTVIQLGKNLKVLVIAEGVETRQQHEMLKEMGCDFAQGFYYSEAVPAEQARKMITDGLDF